MSEWRRGLRASAPLAIPTAAVGLTFGLLAGPVLGTWQAIVMSAVVWSGTAQFAALSVVSTGGSTLVAVVAGLLANVRFLPMGFAIAPSVEGHAWRRAGAAAVLVDASFAIAHRGGGRFSSGSLVGAAPLQYACWVAGTALGAAGNGLIGDPDRWGLDVLFPVFYLSLLLPDLRENPRGRLAACLAAVVALALVPVSPPGVPIVAATAAALLGVRK
jgi:predicted branched-subunit amino acid permease